MLIMICMLGISPLVFAADFGINGLRWNLSRNDIKALETHELIEERPLYLTYRYTADYNADEMFVTYDFDADGLWGFSETRVYHEPNGKAFWEDIRLIKAHTDAILESPIAEESIWSIHTPADFDRDNLIGGLKAGYLRFHVYWESTETKAKLILAPQNYGEEGFLIIKEYCRK